MHPLTVPGTLESLKEISMYVMTAAAATDLDRKRTYRLRLAVDEVATNIIIHGYQASGQQGNLSLQAEFDDHQLEISIRDTAIAYNPYQTQDSLTEQDQDRPLEERPVGGLGLYLAIQGVDRFHYERVDGANHTLFAVNCSPAKA